jgi:hypothetical protein
MARGIVLTFLEEVNRTASCIVEAQDCDKVLQCLHGATEPGVCTTPSASLPAWGLDCTGNILIACIVTVPGTTSGVLFEYNCSRDGLDCVSTPAMSACMSMDCSTPSEPTCYDARVDRCIQEGAHLIVDCGEIAGIFGGMCGDADPAMDGEQIGCVPTRGACDPSTDHPMCEGTLLLECDPLFCRLVATDCSGIGPGWVCNASSGEAQCSPETGLWTCELPVEPSCDCTDVVMCDPHSGQDLRIHCPDLGLETCDPISVYCL